MQIYFDHISPSLNFYKILFTFLHNELYVFSLPFKNKKKSQNKNQNK